MSEIVLKNDCGDLKVDGIAYDGAPCGKFEHLENGKWVE